MTPKSGLTGKHARARRKNWEIPKKNENPSRNSAGKREFTGKLVNFYVHICGSEALWQAPEVHFGSAVVSIGGKNGASFAQKHVLTLRILWYCVYNDKGDT